MSVESKPLGQQYHEAVEALKADGLSNADAIRQVAERFGKEVNAVRGGIHQYTSRHASGNGNANNRRAGRKAPTTVEDLLGTARKALQDARDLVERELDDAKAALDAAQAHYDEVLAGTKDRKADIERKLKALA